jgi:hypothetical protein
MTDSIMRIRLLISYVAWIQAADRQPITSQARENKIFARTSLAVRQATSLLVVYFFEFENSEFGNVLARSELKSKG